MSCVTCHNSPVTCHLLPALPTFKARLVKTTFMLKPLEIRRKKTFGLGEAAAEGLVKDKQKTVSLQEKISVCI